MILSIFSVRGSGWKKTTTDAQKPDCINTFLDTLLYLFMYGVYSSIEEHWVFSLDLFFFVLLE